MADPEVNQVLAQNALIAEALYNMAKLLETIPNATPDQQALLQTAKTQINALQPSHFTFK